MHHLFFMYCMSTDLQPPTKTTLTFSLLQEYFTKLSERTIAYINVDIAVFGKKLHNSAVLLLLEGVTGHVFNLVKQYKILQFTFTPQPMPPTEFQGCHRSRMSSSKLQNRLAF